MGHIRVFGCVAYMRIPSVNLKKLDNRSKMVVNLGKEPGTKAYRLFDPATGRVFVSRDVVFIEQKSWPWSQENNVAAIQMESFTNNNAGESQEAETGEGSDSHSSSNSNSITDTSTYAGSSAENSESEASSAPQNFRSLGEIYADTEEVELEDEELLLMGVEEPADYKQAPRGVNWRKAMSQEMEYVEKNNTWSLTELPPGERR